LENKKKKKTKTRRVFIEKIGMCVKNENKEQTHQNKEKIFFFGKKLIRE